MSDDLRKQIYNNLKLKETDELIEIWQANDRVEWSETAFEAIEEILRERLEQLPEQNEAVFEYVEDESNNLEDEFDDIENAPAFYQPREVLWLEKWLNRAAVASIVMVFIGSILQLGTTQRLILSYFSGDMGSNTIAWLLAVLALVLLVGLEGGLYYFGFKALGYILKILMEMEFNSRGIKEE